MRSGGAFGVGLCGVSLRSDWPNHVAGNSENGATMSSSGAAALHPAWNAHDGDNGAYWQSSGSGAGRYIQVQFDSYRRATAYSLSHFSGTSTDSITFDLLGSTDGAAWTTLDAGAGSPSSGSAIINRALAVQTPFLFYRVAIITSVDSTSTGTARIQSWSFTFSAT